MKRKRKEQPLSPADASCAALSTRLDKLERVISEHFGVGIEQLAENPDHDNPVVEEKRYDRSVLKIHKSGAIERLCICEWCNAEVGDLATHKARCPKRPIY